jgi:CBS domain-containing protein
MQIQGKATRVTIYIGEGDRRHGKPLHMAIVEHLRQSGAAGATVLRGVAGFGAHSRIHNASLIDLAADLPIRIEWIDQTEIVERLLPTVLALVTEGLVTREEIEVLRYAGGRPMDPLTQPVRAIMRAGVTVVHPETPVSEVMALLLQRGYRALPVVDAAGSLVGIITDGDLLRRADLPARLGLQADLTAEERANQAARLLELRAAQIMTMPVVSIGVDESARKAAEFMVQQRLKRLPVVDAQGKLVGLVSRLDVLRTVDFAAGGQEVQAATPRVGSSIAELLEPDVPTVFSDASLEAVMAALEGHHQRRVLVVDGLRQVHGIITDGDLLRRVRRAQRPGFLPRLRSLVTGEPIVEAGQPDTSQTAAELMTTPVLTVRVDATLHAALHLMLDHQIKRLPVVDSNGRLLGLLGRGSLLSGLLATTRDSTR